MRGQLAAGDRGLSAYMRAADLAAKKAWAGVENAELSTLAAAVNDAHVAMRDLQAMSTPRLEELRDIALQVGFDGVKVSGAGGGGALLAVADAAALPALTSALRRAYARRDDRAEVILAPPTRPDWYALNRSPSPESARHAFAGVFLIVDGEPGLIGQLRDDVSGIDNPGRIGPFGGSLQLSEEPRHAAWRELVLEETNLDLRPEDLSFRMRDVAWRSMTGEWEDRHIFLARVSPEMLAALEVYEGGGWALIERAEDPRLIDAYRALVGELLRAVRSDPAVSP